ncbi:MAG TPA: DHA2 family efflux MFS transporter permease subunit [Solirubrobacteraceae bacterium]|jgi:EmrB/QacA subfamily drug resistance transporter|nr:DHA2 family efflux MFS transporter permease subunit [Solirubrobacteraceae bacterium]
MNKAKLDPFIWRVGIVVVLGSAMSILDTTIVNVALKTLAREQHATLSNIQWVVTGYLLSLAAVIPITGWAARSFGAKRVYLFSVIVFTAGSALCGLATSTTELIVFRVLQGVGGGMILPIGQLMLAEAAGPKRMGRVMSIVAVPMMLAPILGPALGGLIVDNLSWRWIFYVNVPIGLIAVPTALRFLPSVERKPADRIDFVGLALVATGLPLLLYGVSEIASTHSFTASKVVIPVLVGIALVVVFVVHALRVKRVKPLLEVRLYRRSTFASASFAMVCLAMALFGGMILLPLYWQSIRHESVLNSGLLQAPQGLGMALVMPLAGRLSDRFGGGPLALFGAVLTALATIPFGFVGTHTSIVFLSVAMLVRGVGIGFAFMPAMTAAFASLEHHELSDATPQLNALQRAAGAIGTGILAVVLQRALTGAHTLGAQAGAYGTAFWWSAAITALAIGPCIVLVVAERRARAAHSEHGDAATPAAEAAMEVAA